MEAAQDIPHPFETDPTLNCYSAKQLAVASTWAKHFFIPAARQRQFLRDYLRSTSSTRCWTTSAVYQGHTLVMCRLGSTLQWFDGRTLQAVSISKQHRIPLSTPSNRAALGLAGRLNNLGRITAEPLMQVDKTLGALQEAEEVVAWPPLLVNGPVICPNGVEVVELLRPVDLIEEGREMRHCVGGYDFSAYRGDCRIVALRQGRNALATAELYIDKATPPSSKRPKVLCAQLRAKGNAPVSTGTHAKAAFDWFIAQLNSGEINSNLNWPNLTLGMDRYTRSSRQELLDEGVANWIDRNLGVRS